MNCHFPAYLGSKGWGEEVWLWLMRDFPVCMMNWSLDERGGLGAKLSFYLGEEPAGWLGLATEDVLL